MPLYETLQSPLKRVLLLLLLLCAVPFCFAQFPPGTNPTIFQGVYVTAEGQPHLRLGLRTTQNGKVEGWFLWRGKKMPVAGSGWISDGYFECLLFENLSDTTNGVRYHCRIEPGDAKHPRRYIVGGLREMKKDGVYSSDVESFAMLRVYEDKKGTCSDYELGEAWADSRGEYIFYNRVQDGNKKGVVDYIIYKTPNLYWAGDGKWLRTPTGYKVQWTDNNSEASVFRKERPENSDSAFIEVDGRRLRLIERAHMVDKL